MNNPIKRLIDYLYERSSKKYAGLIRQYSPEEQELIMRGSLVVLSSLSKEELERFFGIKTEPVGTKPIERVFCGYMKHQLNFWTSREANIYYWLILGRLGADILVDCAYIGPDGSYVEGGKPLRLIESNANHNAIIENARRERRAIYDIKDFL